MSSPDNLDAAILCTIDMTQFEGLKPGDVITGVEELFDEHPFYSDTYW
jgi:hypothetical protein